MHFSLLYDDINSAVAEFQVAHPDKTVVVRDTSNSTKIIDIKVGKKTSHLNIYLQKSGLISYSVQGSNDMLELGEVCFEFIKQKTSLPDTLKKSFSIKKCNVEDFDYLIEELNDKKYNWTIQILIATTAAQHSRIAIQNNKGARVNITLFNNGTFLMQGNVTPLYVAVMTCALEFLRHEDRELSIDLQNTAHMVSDNINDYVDHSEHLTEGDDVLIGLIQSSLTLLNSGIIVSDYACYTFGVLRALEGLMKIRMKMDIGPDVGTKNHAIGTYFVSDVNNIWHFNPSVNNYNAPNKQNLKRSLEHGYTTYNVRRNTLFHTDYNVETTSLLDYNEAREVILETLEIINEICNNWS